ncbi:MAG: hypothetical protein QM778_30585 [Myxococcales bacterium]
MEADLKQRLGADTAAFVAQVTEQASLSFRDFRDSGTISVNGSATFMERLPGRPELVVVSYAGPFGREISARPRIIALDDAVSTGERGQRRVGPYGKLLRRRPDITTLALVRSPFLGAWSQAFRALPLGSSGTVREIPVQLDERKSEQDFILQLLELTPRMPAVLNARCGATVWSSQGLREAAKLILSLEECARVALLSESLRGSRGDAGASAPEYAVSRAAPTTT